MNKIRLSHSPSHWPPLLPRHRPSSLAGLTWKLGSSVIVPTVAVLSKIWAQWLNRTHIHNLSSFHRTIDKQYRSKAFPLITICNHNSCMDDPILWGALMPWKWIWNALRHRWGAAAHDVCFTKQTHALFFALGRSLPVCRGAGVYQPSMETIVQLLRDNQFVHVFPQARVCDEQLDLKQLTDDVQNDRLQADQMKLNDLEDAHKSYALKWGLARMILDVLDEKSVDVVQVLPFYHLGMDQVLPTQEPYIPRVGNHVTVLIRSNGPIAVSREFINKLCHSCQTNNERRIKLMQFFEREMKLLKFEAIKKHAKYV